MNSPLRLRSAKDAVVEEIRALIHHGDLRLGERVSIEELATQFGVSRTPVRDALWQLSAEGLVTIEPRVGVFVREISDREVTDVYRIKGVLEPVMAAWSAKRGTPSQRREFLTSVDNLDAAASSGDVATYVRLLEGRREALLDMAGSQPLRDTLAVLDGRVRLLRFRNLSQPGRLLESSAQHRKVAQCVARGDSVEAEKAMRLHMNDAEDRVRRMLARDTGSHIDDASGRAVGRARRSG